MQSGHFGRWSGCVRALLVGGGLWLMASAAALGQQAATVPVQKTTSAFEQFVSQGGFITWGILIPLSFVALGLIVEHCISIRRGALLPDLLKIQLVALFEQRKYKEIIEATAADPSLLAAVVNAGLVQAGNGLHAMERAMEEMIESRAAGLFRKIEYLNIIAQISPMIGLFGTIYGMILTFSSIVEKGGSPDPADLAGGISLAMVTTFWGLIIAIPSLAVFHLMRNRIDGLLAQCAIQAEELITVFRPLGRGTLVSSREGGEAVAKS